MAAKKKPAVKEVVKKAKPQVKVKIPKQVSSSSDKVWRKLMIRAIQDQANNARYAKSGKTAE